MIKKNIIGVIGEESSGTITVISMINYINLIGITKCSYTEWLLKQAAYDLHLKDNIIYFKDTVRDCISIIYGTHINKVKFNEYSTEWFAIKENRFILEDDIDIRNYTKISSMDLKDKPLSYYITTFNAIIKLKTLEEYLSDILSIGFGKNVYINSTIRKAVDISNKNNICIIADIKNVKEAKAVYANSSTGGIIKVVLSDIANTKIDIDNYITHTIINNNNKMNLFYKVLQFIESIKNMKI